MHSQEQHRKTAYPPVKTNEERALDVLFLMLLALIVLAHWMKP